MKKIFWKIFIPILIAMTCLLAVGILLSVNSSLGQAQDIQQNVPRLYEEAKDIAVEEGEEGLRIWLKDNTDSLLGLDVLLSRRGEPVDLLGRPMPPRSRMVQTGGDRLGARNGNRREGNRREGGRPPPPFMSERANRYPNMQDAEGNEYRMSITREPRTLGNLIRNQRMFWPILLSMILIGGFVSALIARHISRPIQRLRLGAQRIAKGHLKERVAPDFKDRKDEIGELAQDFDAMSEHVSQLLLSQRRMLRDVSHELRSPLARMQVAVGLAEKRSGPEIKPELERIETEVGTLNAMIGKILSLVRLQNLSINQSDLKWQEGDLVKILSSLIKNANYEAQEKEVVVTLLGLDKAPLKLAPNLLQSALENVIRNAVQYTPEKSKVQVCVTKNEGAYLITVRDVGPGVPEESLDKLFEPFYRVSDVREHNKGTGGIGLAIAKRAVEIHGGRIWAQNMKLGLQVNIQI